MPTTHLAGGEKGGCGKTLFAQILLEFALSNMIAFVLAECDRSNPDVGRVYKDACDLIFAYFSDDANRRTKADPLFSEAVKKPVIANLPAQCQQAMTDWFLQDNLHELGKEHGVDFRLWWVSNGGYDSLKLFIASVENLGDVMPHVLVRNWGLSDDWSHVDNDKTLQAVIRKFKVPVINLPKFPYAERNFVQAQQIPLHQALESPDLPLVSKQRIKTFMRQAFAEIERIKCFP